MLRGLLQEIVRRRLWPVPLIALVIAGVAPLLFLKSAPQGGLTPAQAAQSAPAPPAAGELPARAQRLLTTTDAGPSGRARPKKAQDPFQAPAGMRAAAAAAAKSATPATTTGSGGAASKPIPVVITGPKSKSTQPATGSSTSGAGSASSSNSGSASASAPSAGAATVAAVDVRFSKHGTRHVMRSIPRMKPFSVEGMVIASFVRYSPKHRTAIFAVTPGTIVSGAACAKANGTCRYVELRAGKHALLTLVTSVGQLIVRRIDVARITLTPAGGAAEPKSPVGGACLLKKMLKLGLGDPPVKRAACA